MPDKVIGTLQVGSVDWCEVIDPEDDFHILIRTSSPPHEQIRIPKQGAWVLADILKKVDVK